MNVTGGFYIYMWWLFWPFPLHCEILGLRPPPCPAAGSHLPPASSWSWEGWCSTAEGQSIKWWNTNYRTMGSYVHKQKSAKMKICFCLVTLGVFSLFLSLSLLLFSQYSLGRRVTRDTEEYMIHHSNTPVEQSGLWLHTHFQPSPWGNTGLSAGLQSSDRSDMLLCQPLRLNKRKKRAEYDEQGSYKG